MTLKALLISISLIGGFILLAELLKDRLGQGWLIAGATLLVVIVIVLRLMTRTRYRTLVERAQQLNRK